MNPAQRKYRDPWAVAEGRSTCSFYLAVPRYDPYISIVVFVPRKGKWCVGRDSRSRFFPDNPECGLQLDTSGKKLWLTIDGVRVGDYYPGIAVFRCVPKRQGKDERVESRMSRPFQ